MLVFSRRGSFDDDYRAILFISPLEPMLGGLIYESFQQVFMEK